MDCGGKPDTTPCVTDLPGEEGQCRSGTCCTGCWNGSSCPAGRSASECGLGGVACESCVGCQTFCNQPRNTECNPEWGFTPCGCLEGLCTLDAEMCCPNGCNAQGCL